MDADINFDRSIPFYWLDEEKADTPPPEAIVCESRMDLDSRLRQLPKNTKKSSATVCIVLGPKKKTELTCTIPSKVTIDFMAINKSDDDLKVSGLEWGGALPPVGTS